MKMNFKNLLELKMNYFLYLKINGIKNLNIKRFMILFMKRVKSLKNLKLKVKMNQKNLKLLLLIILKIVKKEKDILLISLIIIARNNYLKLVWN
jgi:hypothetical protein